MDVSLDDTGLSRPKVPDHQDLVQMLFLSLSRLPGGRE